MNIISSSFNNHTKRDPPVSEEIIVDIHEYGGVYQKDKIYPGMNKTEITELFPNVIIPDSVDISKGWWKGDTKESEESFKDRVKRVLIKLKEMATSCEEDYTICIISHGLFLNAFFSLLTNVDYLVESNNRILILLFFRPCFWSS
jgi:hypothetical protein